MFGHLCSDCSPQDPDPDKQQCKLQLPSNNNNGESQLIGFSNTVSRKFFSKLEIFSTIVCLSDFPILWSPPTLTETWLGGQPPHTAFASVLFNFSHGIQCLLYFQIYSIYGHLYRNFFFPPRSLCFEIIELHC